MCICVHLCVYAGQYFVCVMLKCLVGCNNEKYHEMQPPRTISISVMMRQSSLFVRVGVVQSKNCDWACDNRTYLHIKIYIYIFEL